MNCMINRKCYEIDQETKIIRQIAMIEHGKPIRIVEAKVKLGGHFILSLYSGQEAVKSIDCPNNGDTILIDKIIDQELGYRLIFNGTESDRDKVFSVTVVYEELPPKQTPSIQPLM